MPPSFVFPSFGKGNSKGGGTPLVVTMENPNNFSLVDIIPPPPTAANSSEKEKQKAKNMRQFRWVFILRIHMAFSVLYWVFSAAFSRLSAAKRRLLTSGEERPGYRGKLLRIIRGFLVAAMMILSFELVAHFKGWYGHNLRVLRPSEIEGFLHWAYLQWLTFRTDNIARPIKLLSDFCVILFMIQSVDRFVLCLGCFWIKVKKIKPRIEEGEVIGGSGDVEAQVSNFPMVLVQIPMCNEREVYEQSISAVCHLDWPKDRLLIQILDDSDDESVQLLIKNEVSKWSQKGVNILYRNRFIRAGYKAGNLKSAMACDYVKDYEFVAIFDADFQPCPDFLKRTVPHFKDNPELALVQARWSFVNKDENLLTRLQYINLSFHFEVEQQVNGIFLNFFGFNGTAGVWRIKALEDSGGWLERTTVEDMDIAIRAHLKGWKFIFLNDVKVLCELPESFEAYRKQQHRWHSGPMQLFRLCLPDIIASKISFWKKVNLIFLFFLLRKLILPFYSFTLFCIILPLTMFIPEAELPIWVICYIPVFMSLLNILPALRSFPFIVPYLLFENTMSVTKFNAMISGLFQLGSAYEWVVTKKTGRSSETDLLAVAERESANLKQKKLHRQASESGLDLLNKLKAQEGDPAKRKDNHVYHKELALAFLLLTAAARSLLSAQGIHFYFLLFQGVTFLVVGLDLVGEQIS